MLRYSAFISYSHVDRRWASWLHRALETYRVPAQLHGKESPFGILGPRLPPVFQDREEMGASSDLGETIRSALEQSANLIVICSPNAVRSHWVNEEIKTYRALHGAHSIHCLIVGGEPHSAHKPGADPALECFPPALFDDGAFDPVAADVRPHAESRTAAKLRLIAGMTGLRFDELRQREAARQHRRLLMITAASMVGIVLTSALAVFALVQRNNAIAQRDLARQKTMTAQRTVDFVKSIFVVGDPSEALGQTITVREVLDRSARRISQSLDNEPNVKAELITTLGDVYGSMGLFKASDALIDRGATIAGVEPATRTKLAVARGESRNRLGDYPAAVGAFRDAMRLADDDRDELIDLRPRILVGLSEAQTAMGDFRSASDAASRALALSRARFGRVDPMTAQVFEVMGYNALMQNDFAKADNAIREALAIRRKAQDPLHPKITDDLNQLGSIQYLLGDNRQAESYFRQVLARDIAVLGPDHPDTAATQNNLARVLLERRKFAEAQTLLQRAIKTTLAQTEESRPTLAFLFGNLALAKEGLGDRSGAEALFRQALVPARAYKHRNLAPLLADYANLLCGQGQVARALPMLDEAAPLMAATYPDAPWRSAWVGQVRGKCLIESGSLAQGAALIRATARPMTDRWRADSLYGAAVRANLRLAAAR